MTSGDQRLDKKTELHLSDGQLLLYADGEQSGRENERARSHLEACWSCRARFDDLQAVIKGVVHFRNKILLPAVAPPPASWPGLEPKLKELDEKLDKMHLADHLYATFRTAFRTPQYVATAAILVLVLGLAVILHGPHVISGPELLSRSQTAEHAMAAVPDNVLYRVVELERRAGTTGELKTRRRIETWMSGATTARAQRVYTDKGQLVAGEWRKADGSQVIYQNTKLRSAPLDPQNPLADDAIWQLLPSAENFASVTGHSDQVTVEERPEVYVLRYRNSPTPGRPRLLNASLTLRRTDLHAIAQTLQVEDDGVAKEYRFVEVTLEKRSLNDISARVFDVDTELEPNPKVMAATAPEPLFVPATAEMEVDVLDRLDRANAFMRERVQVRHTSNGALLVEGTVEDQARKDELLRTLGPLASNAAVHVAISTPSEDTRGPAINQSQRLIVQSVEGEETIAASSTLREYLAASKHLSGEALDQEVRRFSNSVLERSADAQQRAAVLKQICNSLSVADIATLPPSAREQWTDLVQRHIENVRRDLATIRNDLGPVFGSATTNMNLTAEEPGFNAAAMERLAQLTVAVDEAVGRSFASSTRKTSTPAVASLQFWQTLNTAEALASTIAEKVKQ